MTKTKIHFTKKLQNIASKLIKENDNEFSDEAYLGKWNANIFYVDRKKCWFISNGLTKYNIILANIKISDFKNINEIFKNTLFAQLICDGIFLTFEELEQLIGEIEFLPTDNDRSTNAFQNQRMMDLEAYKYDYGSFPQMPFHGIVNRLNKYPIRIEKKSTRNNYTDSTTEMAKLINSRLK